MLCRVNENLTNCVKFNLSIIVIRGAWCRLYGIVSAVKNSYLTGVKMTGRLTGINEVVVSETRMIDVVDGAGEYRCENFEFGEHVLWTDEHKQKHLWNQLRILGTADELNAPWARLNTAWRLFYLAIKNTCKSIISAIGVVRRAWSNLNDKLFHWAQGLYSHAVLLFVCLDKFNVCQHSARMASRSWKFADYILAIVRSFVNIVAIQYVHHYDNILHESQWSVVRCSVIVRPCMQYVVALVSIECN